MNRRVNYNPHPTRGWFSLGCDDRVNGGTAPKAAIKKLVRRIALLSVKMCCVYDMCAVSRLVCVDIKSHSNQELI